MKHYNDITFYKDFNFSKPFPNTYTVQIIGDKARVLNDNPVFGMKAQSRLNKLGYVGSIEDVRLHSLIVEGNLVYFKI